jgi:hypothetical protein
MGESVDLAMPVKYFLCIYNMNTFCLLLRECDTSSEISGGQDRASLC